MNQFPLGNLGSLSIATDIVMADQGLFQTKKNLTSLAIVAMKNGAGNGD
jgi:hypothetical protein